MPASSPSAPAPRCGSPARPSGTRKPRTPSSVCAHTTAQLRDRGEPDPALRAGEHPVLAVAAREGLHARRVGAGGGLGETEAADRPRRAPSAAATPASAPRCPSGGSSPSRASPAPTRMCGCRSRRPRARAPRGRTRRRCGRGIRIPRVSCRARRARRAPARARQETAPGRTSRRCAGGFAHRRRTARGRALLARRQSAARRCPGCRMPSAGLRDRRRPGPSRFAPSADLLVACTTPPILAGEARFPSVRARGRPKWRSCARRAAAVLPGSVGPMVWAPEAGDSR